MAVEERDQCALLGRMRLPSVRRMSSTAWKRNRFAVVQVARDDDRMDVRFSADGWRVAELRRDEPHGQRDVSFRFRRRLGRPELREYGCGSKRAAPCAKILRAVPADSMPQILVDVARRQQAPAV